MMRTLSPGSDGVVVDLDLGLTVFERIGNAPGGVGQFPFLPHGNEAAAEMMGGGGAEDESAGVDADDLVDFPPVGVLEQAFDGEPEEGSIAEDGGDVLEEDAQQ